jgi:hypothetical protein
MKPDNIDIIIKYITEDLNKLSILEINKVYKYIRKIIKEAKK